MKYTTCMGHGTAWPCSACGAAPSPRGAPAPQLSAAHLARAADALQHAEENHDPGRQQAQGEGPLHGAGVPEAGAVRHPQHLLAAARGRGDAGTRVSGMDAERGTGTRSPLAAGPPRLLRSVLAHPSAFHKASSTTGCCPWAQHRPRIGPPPTYFQKASLALVWVVLPDAFCNTARSPSPSSSLPGPSPSPTTGPLLSCCRQSLAPGSPPGCPAASGPAAPAWGHRPGRAPRSGGHRRTRAGGSGRTSPGSRRPRR